MQKLKLALLVSLSVSCLGLYAQDTSAVSDQPRLHHEIGINATMLLKQVFNLSNNTIPTLPYDVTYKCYRKRSAFRFGIGILMDNSKVSRNEFGSSTISGPDGDVPTYNHSFSTSIRAGWEKRFPFEKRFIAYAGIDLAGELANSSAQTTVTYNDLPNYYSFQKTRLSSKSFKAGGGLVGGIQYKINKRLSLLTEIPVYAFYSHGKTETTNYSNALTNANGNYISSTYSETETSSGVKLSITLPVTLYLVVHF